MAYFHSMTLEDYLSFLETYSLYVLKGDVLPPRWKEMWTLLRTGLLYYLRAMGLDAWERHAEAHACIMRCKHGGAGKCYPGIHLLI